VAIALVAGGVGAAGGATATIALRSDRGQASTGTFGQPTDVHAVAAKLLPSVVQIRVRQGSGGDTGSGFVLTRHGLIATNNHVVASAATGATITVVLQDGSRHPASLVGRSPSYDLAVIRVHDASGLVPVTEGDSNRLQVGDPVVAIGSPLGLSGTVTTGIISAKDRPVTVGGNGTPSYLSALQTDAAINPGNSGGPLVNMRGEVIGVNSAIATVGTAQAGQSGSIGLGFSIPIDTVKTVTGELIRTGHAVYPVIGANIDTGYAGSGAKVVKVSAGSPADTAGLRSGDVITAIDGRPVGDGVELIVDIRSHKPGEQVRLTIERGRVTSNLIVTLGRRQG
jgi:putative serine protease PepD